MSDTPTMSDHLDALKPYEGTEHPDEVVSAASGVPVEVVTEWRASLAAIAADAATPQATPEPTPEAKAPAKPAKADKSPKAPPKPEPAPEPEVPQSVVVVTRDAPMPAALGRLFPRVLRRGDTFHGYLAALVWKHARKHVEPWKG